MEIRLELPTEIVIPARKSRGNLFRINLNNYGNKFKVGKAKIIYDVYVKRELEKKAKGVFFEKYYLVFIHHPINNNIDTANIISICSKFSMDSLQHKRDKKNKKIIKEKRLFADDSRREVKGEIYLPGKLSKQPYIELFIYDNQKEFLNKITKWYSENDVENSKFNI